MVVNTLKKIPINSDDGVVYLLSRPPKHAMVLAKCIEFDGTVTTFGKEEFPGSLLSSKGNIAD